MLEVKLIADPGISASVIEKTCAGLGLQASMKGVTKTLPPNIHWHFKQGEEKGVLEITLLLETNEIILSCKENRKADWVIDIMGKLKREFSGQLN